MTFTSRGFARYNWHSFCTVASFKVISMIVWRGDKDPWHRLIFIFLQHIITDLNSVNLSNTSTLGGLHTNLFISKVHSYRKFLTVCICCTYETAYLFRLQWLGSKILRHCRDKAFYLNLVDSAFYINILGQRVYVYIVGQNILW